MNHSQYPSFLSPRYTAIKLGYMPDEAASSLVTMVDGHSTEQCGFVLNDWTFSAVPNVASHPEHSFFMDPQIQLATVRELRHDIIGVYHSHIGPSPEPSTDDMMGWNPLLPWRYFVIANRKVREFVRMHDNQPALIWTGPTTNLACAKP